MRKPPGIQTRTSRVRVLVVSPDEHDHHTLRHVLHSATWTLVKALTLTSALRQLRTSPIDLVVCERDLVPGTWKDVLTGLAALATPPLLIVTSRLADEHLWAEALNLGAYDVLSKPLDVSEWSGVFISRVNTAPNGMIPAAAIDGSRTRQAQHKVRCSIH